MPKKALIEARSYELLKPIALKMNLQLIDTEYIKENTGFVLRIYIDKAGGVMIEDCEQASHTFEPVLDQENLISDPYTLEVSSPGLGRPLKRPHDFEYAMGKTIDIHTYRTIGGKKEFTGILAGFDKQNVIIKNTEEDMIFNRADISLIRLTYDF